MYFLFPWLCNHGRRVKTEFPSALVAVMSRTLCPPTRDLWHMWRNRTCWGKQNTTKVTTTERPVGFHHGLSLDHSLWGEASSLCDTQAAHEEALWVACGQQPMWDRDLPAATRVSLEQLPGAKPPGHRSLCRELGPQQTSPAEPLPASWPSETHEGVHVCYLKTQKWEWLVMQQNITDTIKFLEETQEIMLLWGRQNTLDINNRPFLDPPARVVKIKTKIYKINSIQV